MTIQAQSGRVNQKQRTRTAIVAAARELMQGSAEVTMPAVARAALVSEATAYRYFPDLVSLLREAVDGTWPSPAEALAPVERCDDPVERIAFASEHLLRHVHRYQSAVRAMISASLVKPGSAAMLPALRAVLPHHPLAPLEPTLAPPPPPPFTHTHHDPHPAPAPH